MKRFLFILFGFWAWWLVPIEVLGQSNSTSITWSCWFDETYTTLQTGILTGNQFVLDVDAVAPGFHSLNVQFGTGDRAQLTRYFFFKVATILDTTHATTCLYWYDEDYSTLHTGNIGNGVLMLDVADVSSGFHSLNIQFGTGARAQITRYLFFKTETSSTEPTNPIVYSCWYDQDYEHRQTGTLMDGMFLLDVSMLSDSNHTLFIQMGEGENAQLTSHNLYSKDVHEIIYSQDIPHGRISVSSATDTIFEGRFVFDSATILVIATPDPQYTLQHLVVNGDTVQSPFSMLVTSDVTIEASFVKLLPDLHVTQVFNDLAYAGRTMEVTYTVANHGLAPTPIGAVWYDSIYLVQNADLRMFDPDDQHGFLLSVSNMQGLDTGESYTRTVNVTIPPDMVGSYYLFVLTDMPDAYVIDFSQTGGVVPDPYTPSVTGIPYYYLTAYSHRPGLIEELKKTTISSSNG